KRGAAVRWCSCGQPHPVHPSKCSRPPVRPADGCIMPHQRRTPTETGDSVNFELPPELRQLRQAVREYARAELAPGAAERDAAGRFSRAELEGLAGLGLLCITTPTGHGGSGMGLLTSVTALEEIAAADASVATLPAVTNGFPQGSLVHWGSEWQRSDWLPRLASGDWIGAFCLSEPHCGSDAAAIRTRARKTRDGWVLNGEKAWITAGRDA